MPHVSIIRSASTKQDLAFRENNDIHALPLVECDRVREIPDQAANQFVVICLSGTGLLKHGGQSYSHKTPATVELKLQNNSKQNALAYSSRTRAVQLYRSIVLSTQPRRFQASLRFSTDFHESVSYKRPGQFTDDQLVNFSSRYLKIPIVDCYQSFSSAILNGATLQNPAPSA